MVLRANEAPATLRIASYNVDLSRKAPGLLLRDLTRKKSKDINAALEIITTLNADILLLQGVDYDADHLTITALISRLAEMGAPYPHHFTAPPNRGLASGMDLDGNGRLNDARDNHGYGRFFGDGAMVLLSRYPIDAARAHDFTPLLWRDLPDAQPPMLHGAPFPSADAAEHRRLSSTGHWAVPITLPANTTLHILAFHATPPVFDGPEDLNGRRNHDEILFWRAYLDGHFGPAPNGSFVIMGTANLAPTDGDGRKEALGWLLTDPRLSDPAQTGAPNDPAPRRDLATQDTAHWPNLDLRLRVDYVLPAADIALENSGTLWGDPQSALAKTAARASAHRPVWIDIRQ